MRLMFWRKIAAIVILSVFFISASSGSASTALVPPGKYPPGPIYKAEDLPGLVDKPLKLPAYLVGNFPYVGKVDGKDSFASFTSPPLRLGNTAVIIAFHRNFPAGLVPGRAIKADKREPIALTSVTRAKDGKIIAFGENIFND
jgi:hypothetical protein